MGYAVGFSIAESGISNQSLQIWGDILGGGKGDLLWSGFRGVCVHD